MSLARLSSPLKFLTLFSFFLSIPPASAQVVIHEIMYRPADLNDAEPTQFEFIELFNAGTTDFDLTGCSFDRGINYTFEDNTIIPPGGFLVIAASLPDFNTRYPSVSAVVGPWTGGLSNSGERIELIDALGETIDEIRYSDQGDWAQRIVGEFDDGHRGWEWETAADGGGQSLELINPAADNDSGQNWDQSNDSGGTPGAANSINSPALIPFIQEVNHTPAIPKSSDTVTISAEIVAAGDEVFTPTLFWRISTASPENFAPSPMSAAVGSEVYTGQIPPHPENTVIEFYIAAASADGTRTWPATTDNGQSANALFQFDNEVRFDDQPIYRLILSTPEDQEFTGSNDRSNAMFNATFIADDGSTSPTVRYLCGVRVRGASSRNDNPRPLRVTLPQARPWNGFTELNLNTQFTSLQLIGMRLFQAARLPTPNSKRIQLRRNSINRAGDIPEQYGSYVHLEPLAGDFIDRAFPNADNGNVYKKTRPDESWNWNDGNINDYLGEGWSKQTNSSTNDWSDLDHLLFTFTNPDDPNFIQNVEQIADIDQWMRWFALMAIIANGETNISNGTDDDYSMYTVDGRFVFLPHDLDTIFGEGDNSRIENPTHTVFDMITNRDILEPLVPFFEHPEIRQRYHLALRDLIETIFQPGRFEAFMNQQLRGWVPEAQLTEMKDYLAQRRTFITQLLEDELGPSPGQPLPDTIATLEQAAGNLIISEILANGPDLDFIEIYNTSANDLDLSNFILTDDLESTTPFLFPNGTTLTAGAHLTIELGADAPFSLSRTGETVSLLDNNQALLDAITWGPQIPNFSISRTGPALTTWALTTPTPGATAGAPIALAAPSEISINEWLARSGTFFDADYVELHNRASAPVSLGGFSLSDDPINDPTNATLPPLSYIAPGGFLLFNARGNDADAGDPTDLPFRFSGSNEIISLQAPNGVFIDQINFACLDSGLTQGRVPDGGLDILRLPLASPELPNIEPNPSEPATLNALQLSQDLRITEIMYHNDAAPLAEFIELQNTGTTTLDLSGVAFTDGVDFTFPPGTILAAGVHLTITSDQAAFEATYGTSQTLAGSYSGRLSNGGENVRLSLPPPFETPILNFEYDSEWYPSTSGAGFSLQIVNPSAPASSWGQIESWLPSGNLLGNPGNNGPPVITSGQFTTVTQFSPFQFQITATNGATSFAITPLPAGLTLNPITGLISGSFATAGPRDLTITASNSGGEISAPLQITVIPLPLPELTSPTEAYGLLTIPFVYQITANTELISIAAPTAPAWLTFDPLARTFFGFAPFPGTFTFPITLTNQTGSTTTDLTIIIISDPIPGALDSPVITTSTGDAPWFSQTFITFDGEDAAQSGDIGDNDTSNLSFDITGPETIRFRWRVSSESRFDFLRLFLDDQEIAQIDGEQDWALFTLDIPEGPHTVSWRYTKDSSVSTGADAGWVDLLSTSAYDQWREDNNLPQNTLATDDLDGDGYSTLLEYALGGSPSLRDSNLLPAPLVTAEGISLAFAKPPGAFGIQYLAESSSDLTTWSTDEVEIVTDNATSFEARDIRPLSGNTRRFLRLRVILTAP